MVLPSLSRNAAMLRGLRISGQLGDAGTACDWLHFAHEVRGAHAARLHEKLFLMW